MFLPLCSDPNGTRPRGAACCHQPVKTLLLLLDAKRSGRRPTWLHVGEVHGIELRPENIALVAQRLDRQFLLGARLRMFADIVDRELCIFGSLRQASLEIVETSREPRIMLAQLLHAE